MHDGQQLPLTARAADRSAGPTLVGVQQQQQQQPSGATQARVWWRYYYYLLAEACRTTTTFDDAPCGRLVADAQPSAAGFTDGDLAASGLAHELLLLLCGHDDGRCAAVQNGTTLTHLEAAAAAAAAQVGVGPRSSGGRKWATGVLESWTWCGATQRWVRFGQDLASAAAKVVSRPKIWLLAQLTVLRRLEGNQLAWRARNSHRAWTARPGYCTTHTYM